VVIDIRMLLERAKAGFEQFKSDMFDKELRISMIFTRCETQFRGELENILENIFACVVAGKGEKMYTYVCMAI